MEPAPEPSVDTTVDFGPSASPSEVEGVRPEPHDLDDLTPDLEADARPGDPGSEEHPVVTLMGEAALDDLRRQFVDLMVEVGEAAPVGEAAADIERRRAAVDPDAWETVEQALLGIERFQAEVGAIRALLHEPGGESD